MKLLLLNLFAALTTVSSAIDIRISVKFIVTPAGLRPEAGDIGTQAGFQADVDLGNRILGDTGRGFTIRVVEYLDISPVPLPGHGARYWYDLDARGNRSVFEAAALADKTAWRWNETAINIFVNNSSSGACSFPGGGLSISLGNEVASGTVLHEIGHFMGLLHTHAGDLVSCPELQFPLSQYLGDGDGLAATIRDYSCFRNRGELSRANFNNRGFDELNSTEQAAVNSSWLNVMSYHEAKLLLPEQMDIFADNANTTRNLFCSAHTLYVDRASAGVGIGDLPNDYREWAEAHPPPAFTWGPRNCLTAVINPSAPGEPPFWPPPGWPNAWPPDIGLGRPPAPYYPAEWDWPPLDPPPVEYCFGGPHKSLADGLAQAGQGDALMIRSGTYHEARRIFQKVTLGAHRGTVTIR